MLARCFADAKVTWTLVSGSGKDLLERTARALLIRLVTAIFLTPYLPLVSYFII